MPKVREVGSVILYLSAARSGGRPERIYVARSSIIYDYIDPKEELDPIDSSKP
jgi:hypothetical protein